MNISTPILSSIQQAGQAAHEAHQALKEAVHGHAERVVAGVASQPFSVENDRSFAALRELAGLAQDLQSIEEQLMKAYSKGQSLAAAESTVLQALPLHSPVKSLRHAPLSDTVQDAWVRPAAPAKKRPQRAGSVAPKRMSANDEKVLSYLKSVLDRKNWQALTQAAIGRGANVPLGSVGLALRRLIALGCIVEGSKGSYRIA